MNHVASDRMFLLASLVAVACAAFYEPVIYGNDMGSIERYLRQEMGSRLKDGIELLTVADDGADRFARVPRGRKKTGRAVDRPVPGRMKTGIMKHI